MSKTELNLNGNYSYLSNNFGLHCTEPLHEIDARVMLTMHKCNLSFIEVQLFHGGICQDSPIKRLFSFDLSRLPFVF